MPKVKDPDKVRLFEENGYVLDPRVDCYVNRDQGKIFGPQYADDQSLEVVKANVKEPHDAAAWKIYFSPHAHLSIGNIHKHLGEKP